MPLSPEMGLWLARCRDSTEVKALGAPHRFTALRVGGMGQIYITPGGCQPATRDIQTYSCCVWSSLSITTCSAPLTSFVLNTYWETAYLCGHSTNQIPLASPRKPSIPNIFPLLLFSYALHFGTHFHLIPSLTFRGQDDCRSALLLQRGLSFKLYIVPLPVGPVLLTIRARLGDLRVTSQASAAVGA